MSTIGTSLKRLVKGRKTSKKQETQASPELVKKIEEKAYELYEKRGCVPGYESADWLEAEKIVRAESK